MFIYDWSVHFTVSAEGRELIQVVVYNIQGLEAFYIAHGHSNPIRNYYYYFCFHSKSMMVIYKWNHKPVYQSTHSEVTVLSYCASLNYVTAFPCASWHLQPIYHILTDIHSLLSSGSLQLLSSFFVFSTRTCYLAWATLELDLALSSSHNHFVIIHRRFIQCNFFESIICTILTNTLNRLYFKLAGYSCLHHFVYQIVV